MSKPNGTPHDGHAELFAPGLPDSLPGDLDDEEYEDLAAAEAAWDAEIARRVGQIRSGTNLFDFSDVLAELERLEGGILKPLADFGGDGDPAENEAAWADEIKRRVDEVHAGTAETYAAEDVMAALRLRFG
jgi:hypothetical protein